MCRNVGGNSPLFYYLTMEVTNIKQKISQVVAEYFLDTTCYLVDIHATPTQHITVFVDDVENITIDKCAKLSRYLENYLETNNLVGEKYVLEVSSPGLDNEFKVQQQYTKNLNKNVEVLLSSGEKHIGKLISFDEKELNIEIEKPGANKKEIIVVQEKQLFENIKSVKKHFNFK